MPEWRVIADIVLLGGVGWVVWGLGRAVRSGCASPHFGELEDTLQVLERLRRFIDGSESSIARVVSINPLRDSTRKENQGNEIENCKTTPDAPLVQPCNPGASHRAHESSAVNQT